MSPTPPQNIPSQLPTPGGSTGAPPQVPQALDPDVQTFTKAIAMQEGGGSLLPYDAKGGSGETGRYQFMPDTWNNYAQQVLGDPNAPMTSTNQNKVAYSVFDKWHQQGYTWAQMASMWNAGEGAPNAYKTGNKGINGEGVGYDTPTYVKNVQKYAQQLSQQGGQQQDVSAPIGGLTPPPAPGGAQTNTGSVQIPGLSLPPPPPTVNAPDVPQTSTPGTDPSGGFLQGLGEDLTGSNPDSLGTQLENTVKGAGNFLFPIAGDVANDVTGKNKKTALQQLGDVGTSALGVASLIPGADIVADPLEAARGADLAATGASKAPGILSAVLKSGALGAGFGAAGALGQGQTSLGDIAKSTAIGAGTGGILGAGGHLLGGALAKAGAEDASSRLTAQKNRLKTLNNVFNDNSTSVTDPITTLDQTGLTKDLKVTNGKIDATKLTNPERTGSIDNMIEDHSAQASKLVQGMPGTVPLEDFKAEAENAIRTDPTIRGGLAIPKALANLDTMLSSAEMSYGKDLPYSAIDEIRAGMNKGFNPDEMDTKRVIGNTARAFLYNGDGANAALKSAMQNESELIKARNFVEKLHGTTVPGGQLGKYFADLIGAGVGGAAGSMFGPLGEAVGTGVGGFTTHKIGDAIQSNYFNPIGGRAARGILNVLRSKGGQATTGLGRAGILHGVSGI